MIYNKGRFSHIAGHGTQHLTGLEVHQEPRHFSWPVNPTNPPTSIRAFFDPDKQKQRVIAEGNWFSEF